MRILIYATSPIVNSGYGVAARHLGPRLRDLGHDVAFYAWNTGQGFMEYEGIPMYPKGNTITGHDMLAAVVGHFEADVVIAICDPWIVWPPPAWRQGHNAKLVFWMPIQAAPVHHQMMEAMQIADRCLVYSAFGTQVAEAAGMTAYHLPLGIGPAYKPLDRAECRSELATIIGRPVDDAKIFGMVAANSSTMPVSRKAFDKALMAFKEYQRVMEDGILWLHTHPTRDRGGVDILEMMLGMGLKMGVDVFVPETLALNMGIHDEQMARLYNAFDVALQATVAEGFGLPVVEAQACGTPVIVSDNWQMRELVYNGAACKTSQVWMPGAPGGYGYEPDEYDLARLMIHREFGEMPHVSERLHELYNWDAIAEQMANHLGEVVDG